MQLIAWLKPSWAVSHSDFLRMKTKAFIATFLITSILASCSSKVTSVPIGTTLPTPFFTATPTATLPHVSPTPEATIPSPITFSGEGNAFLTINKWRGPALVHFTYTGSDEFIAWNVNERDHLLDFLLHVWSDYSGTQVLDLGDNESAQTRYLEIHTTGNWEFQILPFEYGRKINVPDVFSGVNNDVVFLQGGKLSSLKIDIDESGYLFIVSGYGDDGFVPIAEGKPPYHGTVKIAQDVKMLIIEALGPWQIKAVGTSK